MKHDAPQIVMAALLTFNLFYVIATEDSTKQRIMSLAFYILFAILLYWGGFF